MVRRLSPSFVKFVHAKHFLEPVESKTRTRYGHGRARQGTAGHGMARWGGVGARRSGAPSRPSISRLLKAAVLEDSLDARKKDIPLKPNRGTRWAVNDRFISRTTAALHSQLLPHGQIFFWILKSVSCKACPGIAEKSTELP